MWKLDAYFWCASGLGTTATTWRYVRHFIFAIQMTSVAIRTMSASLVWRRELDEDRQNRVVAPLWPVPGEHIRLLEAYGDTLPLGQQASLVERNGGELHRVDRVPEPGQVHAVAALAICHRQDLRPGRQARGLRLDKMAWRLTEDEALAGIGKALVPHGEGHRVLRAVRLDEGAHRSRIRVHDLDALG